MFIVLIVIATLLFLYGGMAVLNALANWYDEKWRGRPKRHLGAHRKARAKGWEKWKVSTVSLSPTS